MFIKKLEDIKQEDIPTSNPTLEKYFSLTTSVDNNNDLFNSTDIAGQIISLQFSKSLSSKYSKEKFIHNCSEMFTEKITEKNFFSVIEEVYFSNNNISKLTPLMYLSKPMKEFSSKTKRVLPIFRQMFQKEDDHVELETNLNFIEQDICEIFNDFIIENTTSVKSNSYIEFIDKTFSKDFIQLLKNQQSFKNNVDRFLRFYFFIYSSQLALNLHTNPWKEPTSQKLFFILNHERANTERKELFNFGYKTLIDKVKYLFPYLSLLETLSQKTNIENLKLYHFRELEETERNIKIIDNLNTIYRFRKSMPETIIQSSNLHEAFNSLLTSSVEQFKSSNKKAVLDRFVNAFEKQIAFPFSQIRGKAGKMLVLDQDTIVLLTNLAIGDNEQIRFQDLIEEFKKRSIYFDLRSEDALLELYERIGNVNRKSDSGDAVYVKSI